MTILKITGLKTSHWAVTCVRSISCPAVVRIGSGRLLHLSHSSPFLFPHLHLRLSGPRAHVWHVPFLAFSAVPVRSPLPILNSLFTKTPVSWSPAATSRGALIPPLAQPALHVIVLSLRTLLHGVHLHAVAVITSRALWDRLDPPWSSAAQIYKYKWWLNRLFEHMDYGLYIRNSGADSSMQMLKGTVRHFGKHSYSVNEEK